MLASRSTGSQTNYRGHSAAVSALVTAGANIGETLPDGTGGALSLALANAHIELAARLLDPGADPRAAAQGWTALHQLVWTRRPNSGLADPPPVPTGAMSSLEAARRLLVAGADPNARITKERNLGLNDRTLLNRLSATPFLLASQTADVEMMRLLAKHGADASLTTVDGTTALMAAAGVGIWVVGENPGTNEEALDAVRLAIELPTPRLARRFIEIRERAHRHLSVLRYAMLIRRIRRAGRERRFLAELGHGTRSRNGGGSARVD